MRRSFLDSVLRGAEALAARDPVGTLPDRELLARFAAGGDSAAFAVFVRRHGPLVWGVCRNLLLADADAEDAFQATFLALVRSAPTIRRTDALGGWLHGVAYRVALKARRSAARRKTREKKAAVGEADSPVPDAAWDELQAAVHEEVCKLPDKLRLPFVLCNLQGRPQKDAAKELGWTIGTLSGRLSEARRKLLDRLARRGVPVGMAVGAAVLGGVAGGASVPSVLTAKVLSAAGAPDAVSPSILSLARGVTHVYLTRTKLLAASVVLAGLLTTGIGAKILSRAEAQAPGRNPEPTPDAVKRAIDFLQTRHFNYKFVPVEKPMPESDLQKVLALAEGEGWDYCGAQELINEKTGKVMPHMVFKRQRSNTSANLDAARHAAMAALNEAKAKEAVALKTAQFDALKARDKAAAELEQAARQRNAELEDLRAQEKAAKDRAVAEQHVAQELLKEKQVALEREKAARMQQADQQRQIEALKEQYEVLIRKMEAELKAKATFSGTKSGKPTSAEKPVTVVVKLHNVDGQSLSGSIDKLLLGSKVTAEIRKDSVTLIGPEKQVEEARTMIQKSIDVKNSGASDATKGDDKESEIVTFSLRNSKASEVAEVITKLLGKTKATVTFDANTNKLLVVGTPQVIEKVKAVVIELDSQPRPGK